MPLLRTCSGALGTALAAGPIPYQADLFTVALLSGTTYRWTSWDTDLVVGGSTFVSSAQWLSRGQWGLTYTMQVPTLELYFDEMATTGFGGGTSSLRVKLQQGLFDGAIVLLQRLFMPTAGDVTTYGTIDLFLGDAGAVSIVGPRATLKVRGKNSRLDAPTPRNVYQPSCIHTFCDFGCTLSAATFTFATSVFSSPAPTRSKFASNTIGFLLPFVGGTVKMTSGVNSGQQRSIIDQTGAGPVTLTLADPLPATPSVGDTFTAFQGCNKTMAMCNVSYSNLANFRGFPFIPPPNTTSP